MASLHSRRRPSLFLPTFVRNATADIRDAVPDVLAGNLSLSQMLRFCQNYHIRGIGAALLGGAIGALLLDLSNSGHAFLYFLEHHGARRTAASRNLPFFDSICAKDLSCAEAIAMRSPSTWNRDLEYEDDFLFVHCLMEFFFRRVGAGACRALLADHLRVTGDDGDVQYRLGTALVDGEPNAFRSALDDYLREEADEYQRMLRREELPEEIAATEAHLSVKGLALIRLAEWRGIAVPARLKGLSALERGVRIAPVPGHFPDSWRAAGNVPVFSN